MGMHKMDFKHQLDNQIKKQMDSMRKQIESLKKHINNPILEE